WSAPFADDDSVHVLDPVVKVEILATMVSVSVPSFVITLDCAVRNVLSGCVPNANVVLLADTLSTSPIWKSPTVVWLVIWVDVEFRVPIVVVDHAEPLQRRTMKLAVVAPASMSPATKGYVQLKFVKVRPLPVMVQ